MSKLLIDNTQKLYNTPIEIGLRMLVILNELGSSGSDIEKLMYIDYLSLNTKDIGGEESLHAPIPNRGVQVYARKNLIQKGIRILISKELIEVTSTTDGFYYIIKEAGQIFLKYFSSLYFKELTDKVQWVLKERFNNYSRDEFRTFIKINLPMWGGEFLDYNQIEDIDNE